jgi:hypothetical protein
MSTVRGNNIPGKVGEDHAPPPNEAKPGNSKVLCRTQVSKATLTLPRRRAAMRSGSRYFSSLLLAAAFFVPAVTTGCATHRYQDPYYNDYHRWDRGERVYYNQWVIETHRDNRDFRRLNKNEQRQYWEWRHNHH